MTENSQAWQQQTIERLLLESLQEQRRKRRWGIFFKLLFLSYLIALVYFYYSPAASGISTKKHTALIDIRGTIADSEQASADHIVKALHNAYQDPLTQGIILRINSGGGSGVQADYVYNELQRLRRLKPRLKVYAVCTDVCASAAYYMAAGTDEIYANGASLVGSIGVIMDGFGFVDGMHKLGIERRLLTAGSHKGFLDPFSPVQPGEQQYALNMLEDVHQQFIAKVKQGRGKRLKTNPDLFSGLIWTGNQALALGLIDGLASPGTVAREIIHCENIIDYTLKPNYLEQLANRMGASFSKEITTQFGLRPLGPIVN